MPHRVRLVSRLNEFFAHPLSDDHRGIVDDGGSLVETLSRLDLLGDLSEDEVGALADSLGESVQEAILAAVRSAAQRELPVVFQWRPNHYGSASLFEAVAEDGSGMIGITVEAPWLRDAARASTS